MAKTKKTLDDLNKKYGIKGSITPAKNNGKQNTSASQKSSTTTKNKTSTSSNTATTNNSKTALEKLNEKYGIKGTSNASNKPTSSTTKKNTDFNTETKNAYTSAKNKATTKTTISSSLTEDERKSRIKEIEAEIKQLNTNLYGIGRASAYGNSKALKGMKEETQSRIAELSKELKSLERTGTFTASELKQFEIDDAKAKKSALPTYNPTARVTLAGADAMKKNVSAHYDLDKEIETLEREKKLYDDIAKFGDVVNEDNFGGQWRANYRSTELSREADKAISEYIKNPTEENKQIAYAYDAFSKEYMKNNEKALDDENVKASWLSKSMAGYLPQLKDQIVPELVGGGIGLLLGSAVGAPTAGGAIGAGLGTYSQMYDVMRGSVYRTLLAEGVDEETALQAAEDEALISSLIEGGETAVGWLLAGGGKAIGAISNAAKTSVAKGSTNAATKLIANLAGKATNRAASKAANAVTRPLWKTGLRTAGGIVGNALTEYGEEAIQQGVSMANKERAMQGETGKWDLAKRTGEVIADAVTGKNPEAFAEMHEAGTEGFKIGLMFGGAQTTANNIVSHYANAKTVNLQNEIADTIANDEEALNVLIEEGKASGAGTVSAEIATEIETARENGKGVTREQVKKLIASNETYIKAEEQAAAPATLEQAAREVVAERNKKSGTPLAQRLEAQSQNNEPIAVADVKKATGFGENGAKLVTEIAIKDGMTFEKAIEETKVAYLSGYNSENITFTNELHNRAKLAGIDDRIIDNNIAIEKAKNVTVYKGTFTENKYTKNWSEATKKMVSTVAKHFGMDIKTVDKIIANKFTGAEANALHQDGKMRISSTAEKLIHALVLHESGHRMEQFATAEWNELANFLYKRAEKLGRRAELGLNQGMTFDAVKSEHDNAGISMSTSGYINEIAVRELETIFSSPEEFNSFIAEIETNQQAKSAWGKFVEWLSKLIEDLKTAWSQRKMTAEERAEAKKALAEMERIKELYAKAYLATKDAVAERANTQGENAQNTDTKGDMNFSLMEFEDGKRFVDVVIDQSLFNGKTLQEQAMLAREIIKKRFAGKVIGNLNKVFVNGKSAEEYSWLRRTRNDDTAEAKMRASTELDNLIDAGTNFRNLPDGEFGHIHEDAVGGFSYFDVIFKVGTQYYSGVVNITNNSRGRLLKDVTQIKNITDDVTASYGENPASSVVSDVHSKTISQKPKSVKSNFSLKEKSPTFYSHMGKTIDDMKQDKIGANSVVSYLKGKGVKNEEIKWSGIEEFLQGKKSVSKAELQEFVAGSMLQIDVKSVNDDITINYTQEELAELDAISEDLDNAWFEANDIWNEAYGTDIPIEILGSDDALPAMTRYVIEQHGGLSRFEGISHLSDAERKIYDDNNSITRKIKDLEERQADIRERATARRDNTKQTKYHKYTLDGGSGNYRELLFKLPNSEYTNDAMSMHWGEGGVLAHARIQDFDVDGQKMLFIEEIQSDWHNEGAKKGYVSDTKKLKDELETLKKKNRAEKSALIKQLTQYFEGKVAVPEEEAKRAVMFSTSDTYMDSLVKKYEIPTELVKRIKNHHESQKGEAKLFQKSLAAKKGVEDAPFRNNYHEYVLKNLLRMAAEDGYDSIGWTTAAIQSDRWSEDYAEGYRIEYDQDIPKFLNKYGKKWGAKVGKTVIGREEGHWEDKARWVEKEGTEVWTMPITDSMKNSVLYEGQPMFSLKKPVEETKNLIALHNMQSSELERTLDLGGLPMPSIAIIKAQSGHSEYGDVSLVFDKSVIDPKASKLNKVYGGDAWTPTYPKIEYKPNDKIAKKISDKYYDFSRKFGYDESKPLYSYVYDLEEQLNRNKGEAGMLNELYEDTRVMQLYLLDSGKNKVDTINKETRTELSKSEVEMNEYFINSLGADVVDEVMWDGNGTPLSYRKNYLSKYEGAIRETYKNLLSEVYKFSDEQVQNVLDSTKSFDYLKFVRDAHNYRQNGRVTIKTEADYEATQKAIKEAAGEDYRKWVDSLFKGVEEKSGIRNNVDYFTNNGNRRSWEALHWENNLENVIKVMKSQADVGSVGFFSGQNIWGVAAKNYGSIEEIKADSDRLQRLPEEEYNKIKEGFGQRLSEIAHSIMDKSERNPFIASDNAMECIVDAVRNSKTKSGILNSLRQYQQLTVTETTVDDIVALVNDISNMPTEYFEAKPKRAVELNEIATAIIPDNISQATKTRLDDMGIKYVEYEAGNEQARLEALNSLEDVQFSLKGSNNINAKDTKELLDIIEHLKGEFEITKFAKADPKKLAKMTREVLKEYNSQADFEETYKAIDELYQYMANGEGGQPAVWEDVYRRASDIAREIVRNAVVVDDYMYQEYKSLRDYLRKTPMKFYAGYDSVPVAYENFNDFRKMNMGRLKFTRDGVAIDAVYQELAGLYPEFFDPERENNTADQLEQIINVLDELQPTEVNPFDRQIEQVSMALANDITSRFFDIPQAKPTFADKAERRVVEAHIKGGKKVEAVRQQKDAKIKKLIEAQKEKTKKQLDKIREQRDTKVKKEQEKRRDAISRMSETQKAKVLRAKIIQHTGELNKTLLKATDKKHIPPELENAVVALLYNINMESNYSYDAESHSYKKNDEGLPTNKTKAFQELKAVYEQIAKNNDYGLTIASELFDATGEGVSNIFDDVMKLSDKRIADMTSEELTKIYDTIRLVEHSIATANKMFAMQKWESLTETAKAFEKSVATRRPKHALMKSHLTLDIENPLTFFSHFGEAGVELYQALREAQDNEQVMIDELSERIQGIVSLEEVQKAEKEIFEFTTIEGKKLTLSKAHIMDIYLLYNRKQGKKHLLYDPDSEHFGNGIHQPEIKSKKIRRNAESTRLTKADLGNIISKLSKTDKEIANKMQNATLLLAEWGNKACMKVFGYEKFNDPDYWTIKAARESINQTIEKNKDLARSIKNMGSAKSVEDKATNALDIGGVFNVFNQHASDMICYSAWLEVMEDATKLYNYTFRDANGNKTTRTFDSMLEKYAGEGGSKYYFNLMKDIQNGIGTAPDTATEQLYTKLFGKAAKAKVAFKLTVVAQQPMAIVRAANVLNPLSIIQASVKGGVNLPVWAAAKVKNLVSKDGGKASEWYGGWQRALKYAPIAARKSIGGYEINSNSSGLKGVLYKPETVKGKAIDAAKESPLWAAGKADEITWGVLWNACEIETSKNKSLEKGSDAYYEAVKKLFDKVINETQVVDGVLQRSQLMRSSSGWIKPLTTFKGEPTMALNGVIRAYDQLRYENNSVKRGKAIKNFSRTATVFVASAIFTAFARSLAVGVTGDDDEEYWKKVWKSFSGVKGDEKTWFDYVKNIGLKSDVVNNINPLTWLPVASEMMSALQGYDVERLDVASISDFVAAGKTFINSLDAEGKNTVTYATRNLLLKFAELTGYSPYNLVHDIEGAIRTTRSETNDVRGLYDMEKWRTKPASNVSTYVDILYKAYSTDNEAYKFIYNDMIENGVDADKIQDGMEARMMKAEGVKKKSELSKRYMSPNVEKKYDNSLRQIKSSQVWKSANATQKKEAEADLYSFLTSDSKDMEKTRAEARAFGVDETEYTLYQLAIEMADQPKGQEGSGGYDSKEKAEAINSLSLGDKEIAYFFGKGLNETAKEEVNETLNTGIDMQEYVNFKAAVSEMESDKNAKGNSIPNSKKKKVVNYLNNADLTSEEWDYFYYEIMNYKK